MWTFRDSDHDPIVPIQALATNRGRLLRALAALPRELRDQTGDPGTPLFNTISDGIAELEDPATNPHPREDTVHALVIVTDGGNNPSTELRRLGQVISASKLETLIGATDVEVYATAASTRCDVLFANVDTVPDDHCYSVGGETDIRRRMHQILSDLESLRMGG